MVIPAEGLSPDSHELTSTHTVVRSADDGSLGGARAPDGGPGQPLDLVRLTALMERMQGRPEITIALIDGPVARDVPALPSDRDTGGARRGDPGVCLRRRAPPQLEPWRRPSVGPPPEMCNGLQVPIVGFDQIYSFDVDALVKAIPRSAGIAEDKFSAAAEELFYRIMQLADNAGATDEHRALNYLAVRYHAVYATAAEAHGKNAALASVEVRPSRLSGVRKVVDVVFSFVNRTTDVTEKYFVRVDVTEEFPFLVTKMAPFYDR